MNEEMQKKALMIALVSILDTSGCTTYQNGSHPTVYNQSYPGGYGYQRPYYGYGYGPGFVQPPIVMSPIIPLLQQNMYWQQFGWYGYRPYYQPMMPYGPGSGFNFWFHNKADPDDLFMPAEDVAYDSESEDFL